MGAPGYDTCTGSFSADERAGGTEAGARWPSCRELGYVSPHDQYRDYYYDAPTFDRANALQQIDGTHPYCSVWYGGPHSWLCQALAPDYVRRNYNTFDRLGIPVEGAYLDVFSVVFLDECFNPDHQMSRADCAEKRRECFEILTARGIIPSSEETMTAFAVIASAPSPYSRRWGQTGDSIASRSAVQLYITTAIAHPRKQRFTPVAGWGIYPA